MYDIFEVAAGRVRLGLSEMTNERNKLVNTLIEIRSTCIQWDSFSECQALGAIASILEIANNALEEA